MRRILTIDGGGIKGVFPAALLAAVEEAIDDRIVRYFDLIVGTSTGGIIAIGLGLGLSAQQLLDLYLQHGPTIFGGNKRFRAIRQLMWTKYSAEPPWSALEGIIGDRKLGESSVRLVIPSANVLTGEVYLYKTAHHPKFERDYRERAMTAALATTAAPTYFPVHKSDNGLPVVDGGTFANNPVGLAVVEAIGVLGWPREEIDVLSLGCTTEALDIRTGRNTRQGLAFWARKVVPMMMAA